MANIIIREDLFRLVGGDLIVASLLSKIVFWHPHMKVKDRHGVYWIAHTRKEFCENSGLTEERYKRAVAKLKELRVIESTIHKFNGQPMTHIRLICSRLAELGVQPPTHHGDKAQPNLGVSPNSYKETERLTERQTINLAANAACPNPKENPQKRQERIELEKEEKTGKTEMKLEDIKKKMGALVPVSLEGVWKKAIQQALNRKDQTYLSVKQKSQLKHLRITLGEARAKEVVWYAVENWWVFGNRVKNAKDLRGFPLEPDVGFLLIHHNYALDLMQSIASEEEKPVSVTVSPPTPKPPVKVKEEAYKPTEEDYWDVMNSIPDPSKGD